MTAQGRLLAAMAAVTVACFAVALHTGPASIDVAAGLRHSLAGTDSLDRLILAEVRLPRALLAVAVGATLGLAGAALQGLLRNPLAGPGRQARHHETYRQGTEMARGINKVILVGNLGADPETRYMPSGSAVTNLSVATSESWKDKQTGEQKERTEWHKVAMFNRLAEIAAEYLRKGSQVYIEGKLRTRKWQDRDGNDRWTTEIIADEMQMLGGRGGGGGSAPMSSGQDSGPPSAPPQTGPEDFDDDIPF